jgi:uncharacterized membrane-anchored protein YjiN (DUF445 family)
MKRTRLFAPLSLLFAVLLYAATFPFTDIFFFGLLHAFAEASMVGGLADWFAVVALFRHPLGLPIPHTAILPRQRAKLTAGIIDMVQNTWLAKETIEERVRGWRIMETILRTLESPVLRSSIRRMLARAHADAADALPTGLMASTIADFAREQITTKDLILLIERLAGMGVSRNMHQELVTRFMPDLTEWLESESVRSSVERNLRKISEDYASSPLRRLGKWMAERSSMLDYRDLSETILRTLQDELKDVGGNPVHPLRAALDESVRSAIERMHTDPAFERAVDELRVAALSSDGFATTASLLLDRANDWLARDLASDESATMRFMFTLLDHQIARIRSDDARARGVETWIQDRIIALVDANHDEIGALVARNLNKLDDRQLIAQIEAKVGNDLQYIRVNGAVVGGLVGALLFLIRHLLS